MKRRPIINVVEINSLLMRHHLGISRYFDELDAAYPPHIRVWRIVFYHSPEIKSIEIIPTEKELRVIHPDGFPPATLYGAVISMIGRRLDASSNLIVKCNCLGMESLAYEIKRNWACRTVGVLHCLPHKSAMFPGFPKPNPWRAMDHIISVCDAGLEYLAGVKNMRPASVIHNGAAPIQTKPARRDADAPFVFLFAGGWTAIKGFVKIIPAIRIAAAQHKIKVIFMGAREPDSAKHLKEIKDLPIEELGYVSDRDKIAEYYAAADCALFASDSEACSYAGIDAMSCGLPIISTDANGLIEMFGKEALYVKMDEQKQIDPSEYAAHMIRIMDSKALRLRLGLLSMATYRKKYTAKKMAADTVALYEKLIP